MRALAEETLPIKKCRKFSQTAGEASKQTGWALRTEPVNCIMKNGLWGIYLKKENKRELFVFIFWERKTGYPILQMLNIHLSIHLFVNYNLVSIILPVNIELTPASLHLALAWAVSEITHFWKRGFQTLNSSTTKLWLPECYKIVKGPIMDRSVYQPTQWTVANVAHLYVTQLGGHGHLWCHNRQIFKTACQYVMWPLAS